MSGFKYLRKVNIILKYLYEHVNIISKTILLEVEENVKYTK